MYDVALLIERQLNELDADQIIALHEGLDDTVAYHLLLPVEGSNALLATSIALWGDGWIYEAALAAQALWLLLAAAGKLRLRIPGAGIAWYYLLMTAATMAALVRYLRGGAPLMWEKAEGTR